MTSCQHFITTQHRLESTTFQHQRPRSTSTSFASYLHRKSPTCQPPAMSLTIHHDHRGFGQLQVHTSTFSPLFGLLTVDRSGTRAHPHRSHDTSPSSAPRNHHHLRMTPYPTSTSLALTQLHSRVTPTLCPHHRHVIAHHLHHELSSRLLPSFSIDNTTSSTTGETGTPGLGGDPPSL